MDIQHDMVGAIPEKHLILYSELRIKQSINKYANKNTYIAVARVHF